jgi:hypothetical protein
MSNEFITRKGLIIQSLTTGTTESNILVVDANGLVKLRDNISLGCLPNGDSAGDTPYWNGTSWVTTSSNVFNNGGNVGIGTSTPSEKLEVNGNIKNNGTINTSSLSASTTEDRVVSSTPQGTLKPTPHTIIDAYIDPNGPQAGQLNTTSNWNIYGEYIGTPISDTFQGQRHYNIDYFFEAINDNDWIRLIRG